MKSGRGGQALRTILEPVLTPIFRSWWRVQRGMTLGVRGVATNELGHVLLVRHTYVKGWYFPGGGVEHGETADEAVRREMAEEGGVAIDGAPELVAIYSQHVNFPNDHVLLYRISAWRPCETNALGEISDVGFFPIDALPSDSTPATRARVAELFQGAPRSLYW